ncbi:MAG TPA: conjugal transfer protein TraR [Thermoanaerobacterales bacterium]|nr:conjugal transfer protein TraR [Thermoanaerobacterales bacterium]
MKDTQYFKTRLEEMKKQLEDEMRVLIQRGSEPLKESVGELSSYDNHTSDLGAETFEREKDLGLKDNTKILMMKVNHALDKIRDGSYGICERCGKPIDEERLEAVPYTTLCIECKKEEEKPDDPRSRPLEEDILKYPFGRSFLDESDQNLYDGEDAWQDVARYGTANTPQDEPGAVDYTETDVDGNEKRGIVERGDMIIDEEDPDEDDKNELGE